MKQSILHACAVLAFAGAAGLSAAATLTVPGTHATIADALGAASPGDIIELTNNSTAYTGNIYVTKNNITIRGQAGLVPAPLIQGVSEAHPLASAPAETTPEKFFWKSGDPTTRNFWYDTHGAAVINAAEGLTLRNLRISSDPAESRPVTLNPLATTAGVLDFRFGTGGLVEDCILDGTGPGAIGAERLVMSAYNHTFQNVTFQNGRIPLEQMGGAGTLQVLNSSIMGQQHTLWINGGTANFVGTVIDSSSASGANLGAIVRNAYGPSDVTFTSCVFRKSTGAATNNTFAQIGHEGGGDNTQPDDWGTGRYGPGTVEVRFDQCDFIGGPATQITAGVVSLNGGRSSWVVKTLRFTGCNFYNINSNPFNVGDFPYPGNDYKAGGTVDRFEDYNVFKLAQNMAPAVGMVSGGNSITLAGEPLYTDPAGGDYRLASNSPAATVKGSATPAYSGALGVSGTTVAPVRLTVGHSGADHTTINAAIAAAPDGALIEIIDNSAPYLEDVLINSKNGLTLQGAPSLSPRPVIQPATAGSTILVKLATPSRNATVRNLIIDGTNLANGEKMALDIRDSGETVVENCEVISGPNCNYGVFGQGNRIMRDSNVTQLSGVRGFQHNLSGNWAVLNCSVESNGRAIHLEGGYLLLDDSFVIAKGDQTVQSGFTGRNSYLQIQDSIITSNATGAPASANNLIVINNVSGRRTLEIDNSDIVGSLQNVGAGQSPTGTAIWVVGDTANPPTNFPITYMNVTDSIFHNTTAYSIYFQGNTGTNTIPGLVFDPTAGVEDFNAFKWSPEAFAAQGIAQGANDLNLDGADLYVDAPNDFRLLATSPAATLNSTGVPPYAGSQGVAGSAVNDWAVY